MAANDRHRIRHKGLESGPHSRADILAQLREGRLSLAHAIEVRGKWMTLRQHLAEAAVPPGGEGSESGKGPRGRMPPPPPGGADAPPPPPGSIAPSSSLDALIRSGYIWCGLTFGLPFLMLVFPWLFRSQLGLGGWAGSFLLLATALGSAGYALLRARGVAANLESEGLDDVAASVRNLATGLGVASALLWTFATFA
jgi:hypothetical protein